MGVLKFLGGLALAFLLHVVGLRASPMFSLLVNPFLVFLGLQSMRRGALAGLGTGVLVGFVEDAVRGGVFGLHGCADTIVGFVLANVAQRVVIERAAGVFLAVTGAAAAQQVVLISLQLLLFADPQMPPLIWVIAQTFATGALAAAWFVGARQWHSGYSRWRRNRGTRLRLG